MMPPSSSHMQRVLRVADLVDRSMSFVSSRCSASAAPGPKTRNSAMWQTSNTPAHDAPLVLLDDAAYWTGISHPANGTMRAPRATCSSYSGVRLQRHPSSRIRLAPWRSACSRRRPPTERAPCAEPDAVSLPRSRALDRVGRHDRHLVASSAVALHDRDVPSR